MAVARVDNLGFGRAVEVTRVASPLPPQQSLCSTFDRQSFSFCLDISGDKELLRSPEWQTPTHPSRP